MAPDDIIDAVEQARDLADFQVASTLREYNVIDVVHADDGSAKVVLADPLTNPNQNSASTDLTPYVGFADPVTSPFQLIDRADLDTQGAIEPDPFTSWTRRETIPALKGRDGIRTFYDMKRNDGAVRGGLRVIKTSTQGAEWYVEPASDSVIDQNVAKFVEKCLFEWMENTWEQFLEDALLSLDYGFFAFEKQFSFDPRINKFKLKRLAPIHPLDVQGWIYDSNRALVGIRMEPIDGLPDFTQVAGTQQVQPIEIPINEVLMFVFEMEGGDLRGTSILRSAYPHFYYKSVLYKIDAIQKERHSIGIPQVRLLEGFSDADKKAAINMVRNIRTNEHAYVVLPPRWELSFLSVEGNPVELIPSIEHHDRKIYENIMAAFMGSKEINKESIDTFFKSSRYIAKTIASTINKQLIPEIVDSNFVRFSDYPKLRVRRIGEWEDLRTLTFAVRNLVGSGILTPDANTEKWFRDLVGLPPLDPATARTPMNQQNQMGGGQNQLSNPQDSVKPPRVGLPRQQPNPPIGSPSAQAGTDRSGG